MLPTYQEVKIAVAIWATAFYVCRLIFGEPHRPFIGMGLELQGLMRIVQP